MKLTVHIGICTYLPQVELNMRLVGDAVPIFCVSPRAENNASQLVSQLKATCKCHICLEIWKDPHVYVSVWCGSCPTITS